MIRTDQTACESLWDYVSEVQSRSSPEAYLQLSQFSISASSLSSEVSVFPLVAFMDVSFRECFSSSVVLTAGVCSKGRAAGDSSKDT